jgi:diguanylate cyclase (GGDEF)-like protein/PAS domain S-box-containing protein
MNRMSLEIERTRLLYRWLPISLPVSLAVGAGVILLGIHWPILPVAWWTAASASAISLMLLAFTSWIAAPASHPLLRLSASPASKGPPTPDRDDDPRWRLALEGSGQGLWDWDLRTGRVYYSPRWAQMLGYAPHEIAPTIAARIDRLHPDDRAAAQAALERHFRGETEIYTSEHRLRCKDGSLIWVQDRGQVIARDWAGRPTRVISVQQDITQQRKAEDALTVKDAAATGEGRNCALLEAMPDLMFRLSRDGRYLDCHAGTSDLLYGNPEHFLGKTVEEVLPPEIAHRTRRAIANALHHGRLQLMEHGMEVGGRQHVFEARLVPLGTDEVMAVVRDITAQTQATERIAKLAYVDMLTQLPNRRLLLDRVEHALVTSERTANHGALVFLDLDHFKLLNDTLGHAMGDQLLQQVAQRLRSCVREADTAARLGGDEFVVMLEGLDTQEGMARRMAREIGSTILEVISRPYSLAGHEYTVTPSIGISLFRGRQVGVDELMRRADRAMYQVKQGGRRGLRIFDPAD